MTNRRTTLAVAVLAFAVCYAGVVAGLARAWVSSEVYSYGVAVLAIAAYMVWTKSSYLRSLPDSPDYLLGLPIVFAGIGILAAGHIALLTQLQQASLVVTVAGFVLLLFGRRAFACLWFPLAYVLLGFPIWDALIGQLQPPSQLLSGRIAASLLQAIGTPVLQDGNKLALPTVTLDVMRECSGVNQLLAVLAMALPAGFIFLSSWVRRAALIGFAIVSSYLGNGARIALVGFLATRGLSNGDLRGLHLFEGLVVSALCYLLILACLSGLAATERTGKPAKSNDCAATEGMRQARRPWFEIATLTAALSMGVALLFFRTPDVRLGSDLRTFPTRIGEWSLDSWPRLDRFPAIDDELVQAYPSPQSERRFVAIDDELVRVYRNSSGQQVRLYIGYHRSQREGKELTGEAGHLLNAVSMPIRLQLGSRTVELGEVVRESRSGKRGVLYWYDLNGRMFSSMYLAKRYMAWDALTRGRSNGAVVMVQWESTGTSDAESSRLNAVAFAQSILPLLPTFIPS
jgi:EpsI family protein